MTEAETTAGRPETTHVIVTCTSRKTRPVPAELRLGDVPGHDLTGRSAEWIRRLSAIDPAQLVAAEELYCGEHWMVARGLPAAVSGRQIRLWVCSAGYGLIPATAMVRPYAAAFSGPSDRVPAGPDGARQWWRALAAWRGPAPGQPRSIRALAAEDPSASFVLALSAAYLTACQADISQAVRQVTDPDRFMIISAGARPGGNAAAFMVPASARLQSFLGGTRQALNARIAAHLLSEGISGRAGASRHLAQLQAAQPPLRRYERKKLTDGEVLALIAGRLESSPGTSASRMLRELRDAGYACEQRRFGQLHRLATGQRA